MSEGHYHWEEIFLERCNVVLSKYEDNKNILNKNILEKHLDYLISIADKSEDIIAHQTLTILILRVGAKLPDDLKNRVLESLNWEKDNNIHKWSPYVISLRKIYLEDFKNKILNYKTGLKTFLLNLKIFYDKDLKYSSIGLEQLSFFAKLKKFQHINYIDLSSCGLIDIPKLIIKFPNITLLNLDNNNLTSLPDLIGNMQSLEKLYLMNNKIELISPNIGNLINLRRIILSYNQIETLPSSLRNLKNLRSLNLNNNNINIVPDIFDNLKLSGFNLRNNPVTSIPSSLRESPNTKGLYSTEAFLLSSGK